MAPKRHLIAIVSIAGLLLLGAYAYQAQRPGSPPVQAAPASAGEPVAVEVVTVGEEALVDDVTAVGTLRSNQSVMLRPEVAGRVAVLRFRDGEAVSAGRLLVELDAAVEEAELRQAQANLELARSNYLRTEDLFARKFVSVSARDQAGANLQVAQAAVELALAKLRKTRIAAPFAGVLGIRRVHPGDYVEEGADLVNLEDIASLKVDFRLPEGYLSRVRPGQTLELVSDAFPQRSFPARVEAIDPLLDVEGRAILLRARLDNPGGVLRPGSFARVRLVLGARPAAVILPEEALLPGGEGQAVFRVRDGKAARVAVHLGVRRGSRVEVLEGLAAGDQVVTAGQLKLRDGVAVRVVERSGAAPAAGTASPGRPG
jgi:membrane fusion protein (multidrug efflux system)